MNSDFMKRAVSEAMQGIMARDGGPFGAVVVNQHGDIVGKGHNCVLRNNDPTAHGEIMAIRNACENLNTFDLTGCILYSTAEPCPMCLAACMWANIDKVFYGCTRQDTDNIGFRDDKFYEKLTKHLSNELNYAVKISNDNECKELFKKYSELDATRY